MTYQPRVTLLVTSEETAIGFYPGYPEFLRSRGWDVTLIADSQGRLESSKALQGATTHAVSMRRNPSPMNDLRSLVGLFKTLRRISPDVLVFATPKASLLGAIAGFMLGVPVRSYQMWGLRLETERGIKRKVLLGFEVLTSLLATEIVANSRSLAAEAMRVRVTAGRQILVIGAGSGLGVDLEYYSPTAVTSQLDPSTQRVIGDSRGFTIGFVGRIHPDKGIETLVRAASALSQLRPGVRILLVGAQDGTELNEILRDVPESLAIHVVGGVNDVRPYYSVMDIHCLPTLREGFPNVVLEASAMGLPTITTNATGAIDSVLDGKTGYVFPVGDWDSLCQHMLRLYDEPGLRFELGKSARRFVEEYYSRSVLWDLHERHLKSQHLAVLAARSSRRRKFC
ncbi:glycosyltransferase family 4 protein [Arthrobacter sp. S1_S22]|nr:glycosyltransferase family 4 protein [Arthrobacter sp. S1_S22]